MVFGECHPAATAEDPRLNTSPQTAEYPARLEVDYPEAERDWLTVFLRPLAVAPIAIILALLTGPAADARSQHHLFGAGGILWIPTMLMLVLRRKYPRWWFDWNLELTRFASRVIAYLALLRDEYPSTDQEQRVHLELSYPDARELNRWLPLIKWFLAIPHFIVLSLLAVAAVVSVIFAWLTIVFGGTYPRSLFTFVVGVFRWVFRVQAYAFLLTTDRYPPFRLAP
jgi:Domain of unknown function (DUF4389)